MKNKLLYLLFFAAVIATAGCSKKFLEEMKSYDKFDESIFSNETQTGWYIDRMYNYYFVSYRSPITSVVGLYNDSRTRMTDELGGTVSNLINPNRNVQLANEADAYYGAALPASVSNNPYTRIRYCNFLIEKIDEVGQTLPEAFRKTSKGQMYFLRALQYFDLARIYGGVPIVLQTQQGKADDPDIKAPRAKPSEVFEQIVKDLDSAALMLPIKWTNLATDYGRATAAAALAMKSRVLVTAASPLFNKNWDNPGDARWQKALDASLAADLAVKAAGYGSSINNAKQWGEVTTANDNTFNGEALFVVLLSNTTTTSTGTNSSWENTIRPKDHGATGNALSAPKGMIDLFPLKDGSRPTAANGYVDTFFFENRDPRFYRTFAFSGAKWTIKGNANKNTWLYRWRANPTGSVTYFANTQTTSPAIIRKMSNPSADSTAFANSGTDIFDFRYGELLLNIAECYAATGNTTAAVEYLGKLRSRVGIPQGANNWGIGTPADKYAALEAVLYERRVELAYESKRFWDLQRWMLYGDDPAAGNETNAKLGIPEINGTNRTGYYWQSKTYGSDPLTASQRNSILIDPDNAGTFAAEIDKLKTLYRDKFVMTPLDQALDRDGSTPINILFRQNYYIQGLTHTILANNPWLPQTIGWKDYSGNPGTFDYRE